MKRWKRTLHHDSTSTNIIHKATLISTNTPSTSVSAGPGVVTAECVGNYVNRQCNGFAASLTGGCSIFYGNSSTTPGWVQCENGKEYPNGSLMCSPSVTGDPCAPSGEDPSIVAGPCVICQEKVGGSCKPKPVPKA